MGGGVGVGGGGNSRCPAHVVRDRLTQTGFVLQCFRS